MHPASTQGISLALIVLLFASTAHAEEKPDPWFGEARYFAYQGRYFDALERLDSELAQHYGVDERELDSLHPFLGDAEFSVGDFELQYRMHQRAGRAMRAVMNADVEDAVRNDATYRLARLHFQKGQADEALRTLAEVRGTVPPALNDDIAFLRANLYLATQRPDEASEVLRSLQRSGSLGGFAAYNLGIALLQAGNPDAAVSQLDRAGRRSSTDTPSLAIRDKANLVLGTLRFENEDWDAAQRSLDRVRMSGPFSNQALLRAGWSDISGENFERALVPWNVLSKREPTDIAVQEAWLALPYAYSKLEVHGRAAQLYGNAIESFGSELARVDASIANIRDGEFLKALVRDEIRLDADWVIRLRNLPNAPETYYLMTLMASHEFQTSLQNYLDLEELRRNITAWQGNLDAFEDLITLRRAYFEPKLPKIDARFRELDAQMRLRLEQLGHVNTRLESLLVAPRPELLATADEQSIDAKINALEVALARHDAPSGITLRQRIARLRGLSTFELETEFPERLTEAHQHLREVRSDVERLNEQYASFVRVRQAASHSYEDYDSRIVGLRNRISDAKKRIVSAMAQQGKHLETVAVRELVTRRELLETYQDRARFAFADSYDRASKAQARAQVK